jgi:hypothetical protein
MQTYVTYRMLDGDSVTVEIPIDADEVEVVNLSTYTVESPDLMFFVLDGGFASEWADFSEVVPPNSSLTVKRKFAGNTFVGVIGNGYVCVRAIKHG